MAKDTIDKESRVRTYTDLGRTIAERRRMKRVLQENLPAENLPAEILTEQGKLVVENMRATSPKKRVSSRWP
jgi:hypothetical protein